MDWDQKELQLGPGRYPLGETWGAVQLRIFIDRSVVEVFTQDHRALTMAWPGNGKSPLKVTPYSKDNAYSPKVTAWEIAPIWR